MDPTAAVNLGLLALKSILSLIGELKSQHGLTDDQILAQAKSVAANDEIAYQQLKAALAAPSA